MGVTVTTSACSLLDNSIRGRRPLAHGAPPVAGLPPEARAARRAGLRSRSADAVGASEARPPYPDAAVPDAVVADRDHLGALLSRLFRRDSALR